MELEWDENKAAMNLAKHGIPFEYAARVFLDSYRLEEEELIEYEGEVRRRVIGMVESRIARSLHRTFSTNSNHLCPESNAS